MTEESVYVQPIKGEILRVGVLGLLLGLLIPGLGFLLDKFFITPVFCNVNISSSFCSSTANIGYEIIALLMALGAIVVFAHWQIFRPALIAIGVVVSLWGLNLHLADMATKNLIEYAAISAALYGVTYLLFYWLLRLNNFGLSLALAALATFVLHWLMIR